MGATGDLNRLLRPRSIAVFGGKPAVQVIRQLDRIGYGGAIWPVHPDHAVIEGRAAYRSVTDLPAPPDAAFLAINRHATVPTVAELARRGAGGAVAYASGFAEAGPEGAALQSDLIEAVGAMPLLGPNCYGFINYLDGALLWPDQHGGRRVARGVAIITQSGNIGLNLTMQRRGLPIAYLVTLGNQATVGLAQAIEAVLADERVTAIGLHIEGIADPIRFVAAAAAARRRGVPIVALKTGQSEAGARLTVSHTASLAGADAVADAFLARTAVVRVASIPVLLEALKLLHVAGSLGGRTIASMSCSGGEAALMADAAARSGLDLRPLDEAQAARVAATVPALVTVSNPLDYHTFSWGNETALTETFAAMMAAGYDMTMLVLDFPRSDRCDGRDWDVARRALGAAVRRTGCRAAIVATLPETMPEEQAEAMAVDGIVALAGIEEALLAIEAGARTAELARQAEWNPNPVGPAPGAPRLLTEWEGKRALAKHGLAIPPGRLVASAAEAQLAADDLGYPVAVKAVGAGIAHKTELGAVRLGLGDADAVGEAAHALRGLGSGLLVERMVTDAVAELIVGISRDPVFGLHLVLGAGGVLAELIADRRLLMLPASAADIGAALSALRVSRLLDGHRGGPKGDRGAVIDAVLAVQRFALAHAAYLIELDVNPLMVRPHGRGAVAADALIRLGGG